MVRLSFAEDPQTVSWESGPNALFLLETQHHILPQRYKNVFTYTHTTTHPQISFKRQEHILCCKDYNKLPGRQSYIHKHSKYYNSYMKLL